MDGEGPLARFLSAFLTGAGRDQASVHIRDWHDPEDPATRTHLEQFGSHCVRGTRGAEFVVPLAPVVNAGGLVVDSEVLSDFVGTTLEQTLRPLLSGPGPVRAGIIGVWTDFKVHYLAYELQTRLGRERVAVEGVENLLSSPSQPTSRKRQATPSWRCARMPSHPRR